MNYKESKVSGTEWTRCWHVECHNPIDSGRLITFKDETAISLDNRVLTINNGRACSLALDNTTAADTFNVVSPETGEVIGQSNYLNVYVLLHSLYLHAASLRDAVPVVEPPVGS